MNANNCQIECQLKHMEKHVQELESKFKDYKDVVADRDKMQCMASNGLAQLETMKSKQQCMFDELMIRYNSLCRQYTFTHDQSNKFDEENEVLRLDNKKLNDKLKEHKVLVKDLNAICSTLQDDAKKLHNQLSNANESIHNLQAVTHQTELELKNKDQKIYCFQNKIAEKIAQFKELEDKIRAEQVKHECLKTSKCEIEMENAKIMKSFETEMAAVRGKLNEKSTEHSYFTQYFCKQNQEYEKLNDQLKNLKCRVLELKETYEKEKCCSNMEICRLKDEAKSTCEEFTINSKQLCDTQTEINKMKYELEDQVKITKELTLKVDFLQQDICRYKRAFTLATQKLEAERQQRTNEAQLTDRKAMMQIQEKCELGQLIEEQAWQIKRLKMQIADLKHSRVEHNSLSFTTVLNTYLHLLCDDDQIPKVGDDIDYITECC